MLIVTLFTKCEKKTEQEVVKIPDNAFLDALIEQGVDSDADGEISEAEAEAISYLNISGEYLSGEWNVIGNITDLKGIEAFINLDTLICAYNQIANLDLSGNRKLLMIDCMENRLTSLNLTVQTELLDLNCSQNHLTILDVSNNKRLKALSCCTNQLNYLDVSNNNMLENLLCCSNKLTELEVSNNPALKSLLCGQNQLTSLDVSYNTDLESLDCMNINST
jgi:Leucine-rich repeat (LRR) protein